MTESNSDNALTAAVAEIEQLCADKQRLLASLHDALQRAHTAEEQRDTYDAARVELQETLAERNRELATARRELDEARAELERERVRLAGCGVAALDGSPEQEVQPEGYGWSASYGDAARAFATRQPITEHMVLCLREALAALDRAQGKDAGGSGAAVAAVASGPLTRPADCTSAAAPDPEAPATKCRAPSWCGTTCAGSNGPGMNAVRGVDYVIGWRSELWCSVACRDKAVPQMQGVPGAATANQALTSMFLSQHPGLCGKCAAPIGVCRDGCAREAERSVTNGQERKADNNRDPQAPATLADLRKAFNAVDNADLVETLKKKMAEIHGQPPYRAMKPVPLEHRCAPGFTEADVARIARRVALDTVADVCERADKNARAEWPWPLSRLGEVCRALAAELTGG